MSEQKAVLSASTILDDATKKALDKICTKRRVTASSFLRELLLSEYQYEFGRPLQGVTIKGRFPFKLRTPEEKRLALERQAEGRLAYGRAYSQAKYNIGSHKRKLRDVDLEECRAAGREAYAAAVEEFDRVHFIER